MFILCDTSAILMLLRVAPDMFKDPNYQCVTIRQIREEIFRTAKFKSRYPWLEENRKDIRVLSTSVSAASKIQRHYEIITGINNSGVINPKTDKLFDLSSEDRWVIAFTVVLGYDLTSGDDGLCDFAVEQFDVKIIYPLEIINTWLCDGIIKWDDIKQSYLKAWADQREHKQPNQAKDRFEQLTRMKYFGS